MEKQDEKKAKLLYEFAYETDQSKALELLYQALDIGWATKGTDIPRVILHGDWSILKVAEQAQERIRGIITEFAGVFDLKLSGMVARVVQVGGKISLHYQITGDPFTADDITFIFVRHVENTDHARCQHCGKLFFGTRKGTRHFCCDNCRVSSHLKKKRKAKRRKSK